MLLTSSNILNLYILDKSLFQNPAPSYSTKQHRQMSTFSTFNHNNKLIASGGDDGMVFFFDREFKLIHSISDSDVLDNKITSLSFSSDSKYLAYSSVNGFFKIYNMSNNEYLMSGKLPNGYITSISFNKDNSKIIFTTNLGNIFTYNAPLYNTSNFTMDIRGKINCMKVSPSLDDNICVCTDDGKVLIIDIKNENIVTNLEGFHNGSVTSMSFSPVSPVFICTCGMDGKINFFDIKLSKVIKTINSGLKLTSITFNSKGDEVYCGDIDGNVYLFEIRNNSDSPKIKFTGNQGMINHIEIRDVKPSINSTSSLKNKQSINKNASNKNINNNISNKSETIIGSSIDSRKMNVFPNESQKTNNKNNLLSLSHKNSINIDSKDINKINNKKNNNDDVQMIKNDFDDGVNNNNIISTNSNNNNDFISNNLYKSNNNIINDNVNNNNNYKASNTNPNQSSSNNGYTYNMLNPSSNILNNSNLVGYNTDNVRVNLHNNNKGGGVDPATREFIQQCVETESNRIRQYVHDEITNLHLAIINQLQIQQNTMMQSIREALNLNNQMKEELDRLKRENESLKSKFF